MGQHHLPGTPPVPLTLRRSARARRISLRISQLDGRVTLTLPRGVAEREAIDFARSKEDWIREHLAAQPGRSVPVLGGTIPIEGVPTRIEAAGGARLLWQAGTIRVPEAALALVRDLAAGMAAQLSGAGPHPAPDRPAGFGQIW